MNLAIFSALSLFYLGGTIAATAIIPFWAAGGRICGAAIMPPLICGIAIMPFI
jgi:hypothetical protein